MALNDFLSAVAVASKKYAPQYGLSPSELQMLLITTAGLEGGLGDQPGVGDGGASHGRFQFNTAGGHGSTLLNQGWTLDDFYDDNKVVDHWAPILAQSLATMKQQGYTGGEAMRQAAYAVERPAAIYPAERFNAVASQAAGLMGGAPVSSGGGSGGGGLDGDSIGQIRKRLQQAALDALSRYQSTGDPDAYAEWQQTLFDLGTFEDSVPEDSDPNKAAQDAFDNAIKLGDYEGRQADRAYSRWSDKATMARSAAENEIASVEDRNSNLIEQRQADFGLNGQGPRSNIATYYAPTYEKAVEKWNRIFGVGSEPSSGYDSGLSVPSAVQPGGSGSFEDPGSEGPGLAPLEGAQIGNFKYFAGQRVITPEEEYPSSLTKIPFGKVAYNAIQGFRGKDVGGSRQVDEDIEYGLGRAARAATDIAGLGASKAASGYNSTKTKAKKWWQDVTSPQSYKFGIPSYAAGTMNHPGGPAFMNEQGPETVIPAFGEPYVAQGGPHVANLGEGDAVVPAGIPPEEAFYFAKIRQALANGRAGGNPVTSPEAQAMRARDPQLQQKVMESLQKGIAANDATNPPPTPVLTGPQPDLWADWRPLTGIPATLQEQQAKQAAARKGA